MKQIINFLGKQNIVLHQTAWEDKQPKEYPDLSFQYGYLEKSLLTQLWVLGLYRVFLKNRDSPSPP